MRAFVAFFRAMKQMLGWVWMAGAIAVVIAIQALRQYEPFSSFDSALNGARGLIPAGIAIIVVGAGLVIGAWVHGMALDGQRVQPGKISGSYSGPNVGGGLSGGRRIGLFKGNLLWGASFYEEAGFAEVKRAWHSGAWLQDHRMFRATLVLIGAPILLVGAFGTGALAIDVTAVRLLLLLSLVYALARLSFALARA